MGKKVFMSLLAALFVLSACSTAIAEQESFTVAVLPFAERNSSVKGQGQMVADLVFAGLVENPKLWLVEREDLKKILNEAEINLSGMVNNDQANKIGQLTGAKFLITGSVFKVKNKTYIVAKIIGSETSRVIGKSVKGTDSVDTLADKLAKDLSKAITDGGAKLLPKIRSRKDIIADISKKIGDAEKPKVYVKIEERHVAQSTIDPAAQTEIQLICKELQFPLTENKQEADIVISGEGFSETALRRGNLTSVKARVEAKAVDKNGNIVAVDRQTAVVVDIAEQIAGKKALQEAAAKIADRILPKIVKK